PHDPQPAKVPLLGPPVAIGELKAAHQGLARRLVELAPSAAVSLHRDHDLPAALPSRDDGFRAWHVSLPLQERNPKIRINRRMGVVSACAASRPDPPEPEHAGDASACGPS